MLIAGYVATRDYFDWGAVHAALRIQFSFRQFRAVQAVAPVRATIDKADFDGIFVSVRQRREDALNLLAPATQRQDCRY